MTSANDNTRGLPSAHDQGGQAGEDVLAIALAEMARDLQNQSPQELLMAIADSAVAVIPSLGGPTSPGEPRLRLLSEACWRFSSSSKPRIWGRSTSSPAIPKRSLTNQSMSDSSSQRTRQLPSPVLRKSPSSTRLSISRDMISVAKGILMERFKIDEHQAFLLLVKVSNRTNTKLHEQAERLVYTGLMEQSPF